MTTIVVEGGSVHSAHHENDGRDDLVRVINFDIEGLDEKRLTEVTHITRPITRLASIVYLHTTADHYMIGG